MSESLHDIAPGVATPVITETSAITELKSDLAIAQAEYEQAKADFDMAKLELDNAKMDLEEALDGEEEV